MPKIPIPFLWDLENLNLVTMWTYHRGMSGIHDPPYLCLFFLQGPKNEKMGQKCHFFGYFEFPGHWTLNALQIRNFLFGVKTW